MNVTLISDTHGLHKGLTVPKTDLLIHAGDFSKLGTVQEVVDFMTWFTHLDATHKVLIAGNHDFLAEKEPAVFKALIPRDCIYLEDDFVMIEGLKIWGSPITPYFFNWAFNRHRGKEIKKYWDLIPEDVDILVTHGPPLGILDKTSRGDLVGCEDLLERVLKIKPKLHVFGHIHEAAGQLERDGTVFVNASVLNLAYNLVNLPVVLVV